MSNKNSQTNKTLETFALYSIFFVVAVNIVYKILILFLMLQSVSLFSSFNQHCNEINKI